jgi:hypothetical protein
VREYNSHDSQPDAEPSLLEVRMLTTLWPGGAVVSLAVIAVAVGLVAVRRHTIDNSDGRGGRRRRDHDRFARHVHTMSTVTDPHAAATAMHALVGLAHTDPALRQPAVDALCAYLRRPPTTQTPTQTPPSRDDHYGDRSAESPPRPTAAARIAVALLRHHLDPAAPCGQHWPDLHLNLDDATVEDLDLRAAAFRSASCTRTRFLGTTRFDAAHVSRRLVLTDAVFTGPALFDELEVCGPMRVDGAQFQASASFAGAAFHGRVSFVAATFAARTDFSGARFHGDTVLDEPGRGPATFDDRVVFTGAMFATSSFGAVVFPVGTTFRGVEFAEAPHVTDRATAAPAHGTPCAPAGA